jgi:hypothetical protein
MMFMSAVVYLATAAAAPAMQPQMVRAQDPESIVNAMRANGFVAELTTDKTGDPMIRSVVSGRNFQVLFYNCTDHSQCATVQLHVGYDLKSSPSLESINAWNRSQRFGRAHLDSENDPILEMDIDLDDGGMNPLLFADNLEFWTSSISRFEKHIGFGS